MTNFLPPPDRETFEKEIDELFEQVRGSKDSFARFLNIHPGTVSKRLNPYNEDHISSFYQIIRDIAALRFVSADLAKTVWRKVCLEMEKLVNEEAVGQVSVSDSLIQIHEKVGELWRAKSNNEPLNTLIAKSADVETEAREVKDHFIAMRNEKHYGKDVN